MLMKQWLSIWRTLSGIWILKKQALAEIAAKLKLDKETLNCLDIIASNNRFAELLPILDEFKHIWYRKNGIVEVEVQSAGALSPAQDKSLTAALEKCFPEKWLSIIKSVLKFWAD